MVKTRLNRAAKINVFAIIPARIRVASLKFLQSESLGWQSAATAAASSSPTAAAST